MYSFYYKNLFRESESFSDFTKTFEAVKDNFSINFLACGDEKLWLQEKVNGKKLNSTSARGKPPEI